MTEPLWHFTIGDGPLVATAIHDGTAMRPELRDRLALTDAEKLYEEDPHTSIWASIAPTRIVGCRSRFEVDLNRPRDKAIYLSPDDAWGLQVWREPLPDDAVARSLDQYDQFYALARLVFEQLVMRQQRLVVFDLHTYNHRRQGPDGPVAKSEENPEINVGTGTMQRDRWTPLVESCLTALANFDYLGRRLDVRENVKFRGGNFARWLHATFPESVCVLSLEMKKFFMDEWTGEADDDQVVAIGAALAQAGEAVRQALRRSS